MLSPQAAILEDKHLTYTDVTNEIKQTGLEIWNSEESSGYALKLIGKAPNMFSITSPVMKLAFPQYIGINVYESEKERIAARDDLESKLATAKFEASVKSYEVKNVLLLYWTHESSQLNIPLFDDRIIQAVEELHKY